MFHFLGAILIVISISGVQSSSNFLKDDGKSISISPFRSSDPFFSIDLKEALSRFYPSVAVTMTDNICCFETTGLKNSACRHDFKKDLIFSFQYNRDREVCEIRLKLKHAFNNFRNYSPQNETQQQLLQIAQDFVNDKYQKSGLFIAGPKNVGKTHIAVSMAKEFIKKGKKIIYFQPDGLFYLLLPEKKDDLQSYDIYIVDKLRKPQYQEMKAPFGYCIKKDLDWQNQKHLFIYLVELVSSHKEKRIVVIDNDFCEDFFKEFFNNENNSLLESLTNPLKNLFIDINVEA